MSIGALVEEEEHIRLVSDRVMVSFIGASVGSAVEDADLPHDLIVLAPYLGLRPVSSPSVEHPPG